MRKWLCADLHIHTCLSPCADLTISPMRAVTCARRRKLDMIAVCDHNSAENVTAACAVGREKGVAVLPGMEITTREEVHLLAIFDHPRQALELQAAVYARLPAGQNDEKLFGRQIIANENDEVEGYNPRLLISATSWPLADAVKKIHELDGLAIPAHVDRPAFGILGQLGFIPENLDLDALEISPQTRLEQIRRSESASSRFPMYHASDAHELKDIGRARAWFLVSAPTVNELRRVFRSTKHAGLRSKTYHG